MIIKVMAARSDPGATMRYLMGRGHTEHLDEHQHRHTDQHVVGGVAFPGLGGRELADAVADSLRFPALCAGLPGRAKHVQHVVLSLSATETAAHGATGLTDARWDAITADYLETMGWAEATYTVVRHGLSADGNDHVHLVLTTALPDGRRLNTGFTGRRSQQVATDLERRHGLQVLASRREGVSARQVTAGEAGMARRTGAPAPRTELAATMRAAATAAGSEAEYVRRLRGAGLGVRPRIDAQGMVTGYSVTGGAGVAFGAGRIARDLSLPALRAGAGWSDTVEDRAEAAATWRGRSAAGVGRESWAGTARPEQVAAVTADLRAAGLAWAGLNGPGRARYAGDLSGALAAAAKRTGDPELAAAARTAGRWAQRRGPAPAAAGGRRAFKAAAMLMQAAGGGSSSDAVARAVVDALMVLYRQHQARRAAMTTATRGPTPTATAAIRYQASRSQVPSPGWTTRPPMTPPSPTRAFPARPR